MSGSAPQEMTLFLRKKCVGLHWLCLAYLAIACVGTIFIYDRIGTDGFSLLGAIAVFIVAVVMSSAIWEAMQPPPRSSTHGTKLAAVRMVLQILGDIIFIPVYAMRPPEKPLMGFQRTPLNLEILSKCPSLESFHQTPWLRNVYVAFIYLMYGDFVLVPPASKFDKYVRRELVETPDGGQLALDWWEEEDLMHMTSKAKRILFIGSTFTGDAMVTATREMCKAYTRSGWRVVVMVKRGCGFSMPNTHPGVKDGEQYPKPWCLASTEDMKLCIDLVAERYPGIPICGVGLSTGAGQLRDYVGRAGANSKLAAAVIADAAPEWEWAMSELDKNIPLIAQALGVAAQQTLKAGGTEKASMKGGNFNQILSQGLMEAVRDYMAPAHGYEHSDEGARQYMKDCQPAPASGIAVPTLEMISLNDTLITPVMVERIYNLHKENPNVVTCVTIEGTHMVRWEGNSPSCWISRTSEEYFNAVLTAKAADAQSSSLQKKGKTQQTKQRR